MKYALKYSLAIVFLGGIFMTGCGKTINDYYATTTWEYINESSYDLTITGNEYEPYLSFDLPKEANHSFDVIFGTGKYVSEKDFFSPYEEEYTKITLDGGKVITDTPITDIENYAVEKVSDRHYKFTYTFTDADFPEEE